MAAARKAAAQEEAGRRKAEAEARALMERIRAAGRLDFDNDVPDPRFGVEKMYEPGGGKMLGVLLAVGGVEALSHDRGEGRASSV